MQFLAVDGRGFSGDCSSVILPALSIGNVGQLAADLIVSSSGARRVAYLDDPAVVPCVGNDAFGPDADGDLCLPLEVYESASCGLTVVQQRSPVIKGMMLGFAKNMANFLCSLGNKHVIILSSLDSGKRRRIDASSRLDIYYISSSIADGSDPECDNLGWRKHEEYSSSQKRWKHLSCLAENDSLSGEFLDDDDELTDSDYYPSLPFAALFSFCKAKGLRVTCILCYCSEGDNISDSFQLAEAACRLLNVPSDKLSGNGPGGWVIPLSWKTVYGPPPDMSMF